MTHGINATSDCRLVAGDDLGVAARRRLRKLTNSGPDGGSSEAGSHIGAGRCTHHRCAYYRSGHVRSRTHHSSGDSGAYYRSGNVCPGNGGTD